MERVLFNDGQPQDAVRLIALTARNLMMVSAHKSATRYQPPVDGRPASEAVRDLVDDLRMFGAANIHERMALRPGEVFRPGSGRPVDLADRLIDVAHLVKHAQCKLAGGPQRAWALTDRYVRRPGWFQDHSGVNQVKLGRMRSTPAASRIRSDGTREEVPDPLAPYRVLWSGAFVRTTLAAALPPGILDLSPTAQVNTMRGLHERIEELWAPHADDLFPFEIFSFAMDFTLHGPRDILATIETIRPDIREPAGRRAAKLARPLHDLLPQLSDLFDVRTSYVRGRFSIENGQPMLATRMVRVS